MRLPKLQQQPAVRDKRTLETCCISYVHTRTRAIYVTERDKPTIDTTLSSCIFRTAASALHDVDRLEEKVREKDEEIKQMQAKLIDAATRFDELPEWKRRRSSVVQR